MDTSRIFVRNLPPNYSEAEFKSHFSQRTAVTDTKLLPARRIGYVGFKTPEEAAGAVKYFNKSFIRMSRIYVELANATLPKTGETRPTRKKYNPVPDSTAHQQGRQNPLKRKRDDRLVPPQAQAPPEQDENGANAASTEPDVEPEPAHGAQNAPKSEDRDRDDHNAEPPSESVSDRDWMRTRTSRLLGLLDDDEEEDYSRGPVHSQQSPNLEEEEGDAESHAAKPMEEQASEPQPARPQPSESQPTDPNIESIRASRRLFLRNLAYSASEDDIRALFVKSGKVNEVHLPLDSKTNEPKGFAFVQFDDSEEAVAAYKTFDGTVFQGRLLHVLPGQEKHSTKLDEFAISQLSPKKQKQIQRKAQAASASFNWNSLFMNMDAVMSSISARLGIRKSELIDPSSSSAAVKQAQAETHVIQETKKYFQSHGVNLDAFNHGERSDNFFLVKNIPYERTHDELRSLFSEHGTILRMLVPPSGTIAIVEYAQATQARAAFSTLAYRKYKGSVLFLEKGPKGLFDAPVTKDGSETSSRITAPKPSSSDLVDQTAAAASDQNMDTSTLFVRNLNFATSNDRFVEVFRPLDGFLSGRVKTKPDPKNTGQTLSMGFGFLEFRSKEQARAALVAMNGYNLDGHQLLIKASHKGLDAAAERRKEDLAKKNKLRRSKVVIKNLPFEASKQDVRDLFKSYGQLRAVRLPKKFDNSRKGFAFAEFTTPREAENAINALKDTHLLGRRLVLDFAAGEADDPELELQKMQAKIGKQTNSVALQQLTSSRKKFRVDDEEE